jgi:two-component system phosphate regulon response regulator OmpR
MRAILDREKVHLVLLDWMIPGEDGLSLARYVRQHSEIPVIMLTGKGDLIDRVVGLEAGADDYITKPFELREVLARIRTVMRRAQPRPVSQPAHTPPLPRQARCSCSTGWRLDLVRTRTPAHQRRGCAATAAGSSSCFTFSPTPQPRAHPQSVIDLVKGPRVGGLRPRHRHASRAAAQKNRSRSGQSRSW